MEFEEFARRVGDAVGSPPKTRTSDVAAWSSASRGVEMTLVPPRNVGVSLEGGPQTETRWYPIDEALVSTVSHRIAALLGGN